MWAGCRFQRAECNKKSRQLCRGEFISLVCPWGLECKAAGFDSTEHRCCRKEKLLIGAAGADTPSRIIPSSVRQLPILTALHARFPTLFASIIHPAGVKVKRFFDISIKIYQITVFVFPTAAVLGIFPPPAHSTGIKDSLFRAGMFPVFCTVLLPAALGFSVPPC